MTDHGRFAIPDPSLNPLHHDCTGESEEVDFDVVVVGAGPTGLLLAGDLAAAGVEVAVLERRRFESNFTRAFAVHARTLEVLQMRGLAEDLVAAGKPTPGLRLFGRVDVRLTQLDSRYNFVLVAPQYETENLLLGRALDHGAHLLKDRTVTEVVQSAHHAAAIVDNGGRDEPVTARWIIAADGANSSIRASLGVDFPGRSAVRSVMLADVRLTEEPPNALTVNAVGEGFAFIAAFGDGYHRVIAWDRRRQKSQEAAVDLDELRDITKLVLGSDFGMHSPRWMSRFHSDERQVQRYRHQRVFLAGDAAHVHSPAGGQGMNTSLQDAANLSWKLTAVVKGRAPAQLLDSYHQERHPVGRAALESSDRLLQLALIEPRWKRLIRDTAGTVLAHVPPVRSAIANQISGIGIHYGNHPAPIGRRASDQDVGTPTGDHSNLYREIAGLRFALLLPATNRPQHDHNASFPDNSDDLTVLTSCQRETAATLVRPDGYIAWQGPTRTRDIAAALHHRYTV